MGRWIWVWCELWNRFLIQGTFDKIPRLGDFFSGWCKLLVVSGGIKITLAKMCRMWQNIWRTEEK